MPEVRKYWDPPGEGLTNNISLMLHLRPDLVNMSEETYKKEKQLFGDRFEARALTEVRFKGVPIRVYISNRDLTDTSGYGPHIDKVNYVKESSAELGERMLTTAVDFIVEFIDEFRKVKIPPL
jgi:creatinine amidohydrolase/Fe(II)-dependent formamide hydrolase-like protein